MAEDNARWFVIHTYAGYENKVASNILTVVRNRGMEDQILEIKIPTETVVEYKPKKKPRAKAKKSTEAASSTTPVATNKADSSITDEGKNASETAEEMEKCVTERILFPSYVFIKLNCIYQKRSDSIYKKPSDGDTSDDPDQMVLTMTDDAWYVIRNTRGVTSFVGPGSKPVPLSDKEVEDLGIDRRKVEVTYEVGDLVTILAGQLEGYSGIVSAIDLEKETVDVTISMFGRETPYTGLKLSDVRPVEE